jgi:hypothetical protein
MHAKLQSLPQSLLSALGRSNRQDQLATGLASMTPPVQLRQQRHGQLYPVRVESHGLDLMVQCTNPESDEPQQLWGLHSFTLHTTTSDPAHPWSFAWPEGMDPNTFKAADVAQLFGMVGDESALVTPSMTCFSLPGVDGQTWSMVCMFCPQSERLHTLSLIRTGEWLFDQTDAVAVATPTPGATKVS